jgi:hypothetical protein
MCFICNRKEYGGQGDVRISEKRSIESVMEYWHLENEQ